MISPTTTAAASRPGELTGKQAQASGRLNQSYDDFLRLLTTQMQYQDPLNPTDSNQFTQQLVAFSGVEQQINMNQKLDSLAASMNRQSLSAALDYIGMEVTYAGRHLRFDGQDVALRYELPQPASAARILIRDEGGQVIWQADARTGAGAHVYEWSGKTLSGAPAAAGRYRVEVAALDKDDKPLAATTYVTGRVDSVETAPAAEGGGLILQIGRERVPDTAVVGARQAATATA